MFVSINNNFFRGANSELQNNKQKTWRRMEMRIFLSNKTERETESESEREREGYNILFVIGKGRWDGRERGDGNRRQQMIYVQ